jgi:predicted MPP superfamily phosphohydrolase
MGLVKTLARGTLGAVGLVLLWSTIEPYIIDQQEYEVEIPSLPVSWDGQRVALIADLQVGMWLGNTWTIQRIVRRIVEQKPAVTLIAGDLVYHAAQDHRKALCMVTRLLEPLTSAGIPTYAVLGNHDYAMPTKDFLRDDALAAAVCQALQTIGIRVLKNEAVTLLPKSGSRQEPLYLIGIGAHTPGEDNPVAALASVPPSAPRFVMMHHPNSFEALPAGSAPVAVAGHTHGGQFHIPLVPDEALLTYKHEDRVHKDGWISGYGNLGNRLYVNRGIGFSVAPLRFNCPPELTFFTLRGTAK